MLIEEPSENAAAERVLGLDQAQHRRDCRARPAGRAGRRSSAFGKKAKPSKRAGNSGALSRRPHELDYEVGRKIVETVPGIDQVRFANSGSEATQAAIRLARAYTGKDKILKWEGELQRLPRLPRVLARAGARGRGHRERSRARCRLGPASPRPSRRP